VNSTSVPLIRGDPSARSVAMVACFARPNASRTRAESSGASCSISRHLAMAHRVPRTTDEREGSGRRR
jgi:hypothetical protein